MTDPLPARALLGVFVLTLLAASGSFAADNDLPDVIDDEAVVKKLEKDGAELVTDKKATPYEKLAKQLDRKQTKLELPAPGVAEYKVEELYKLCKPGVLILGLIYKCSDCPEWHASPASAFVIGADGVCVSNYHVFEPSEGEDIKGVVALTASGELYPVTEILAANKTDDIAIFKLETKGKKLQTLPLGPSAQPGAPIAVISHPAEHFYTYSTGMVSRYAKLKDEDGSVADGMYVTADFARGSSGAPVLNARGDVVGMVASTESCYYDDDGKAQKDLQMVFKACVPVTRIQRLLKKP